jgi:thioredoxin reductase (NADPH)
MLLEGQNFGGYIPNIELIENFTGTSRISGQELSANMLAQVKQYDAKLVFAEATEIQVDDKRIYLTTSDGDLFETNALIIASGSYPRKLNIPGEQQFFGKGVFYCAACDAYQFQNKIVAVAGGGDSALTEAMNIANIASEVVIIEIMPDLTGTRILCDAAVNYPKIEVLCGVQIVKIIGNEKVESLDLLDLETQTNGKLDVDGILVHVGRIPNTGFLKEVVPLSDDGFILVNDQMETRVPGIYAAGDVRYNSPMQIISACGDGAIAAISAIKRLALR